MRLKAKKVSTKQHVRYEMDGKVLDSGGIKIESKGKEAANVKINSCSVTGHISKKLYSINLQFYQSPLMRIVLSIVQSCTGDVQHQSSHIHLLAIESIFIKDVYNCTLIILDKSQLK